MFKSSNHLEKIRIGAPVNVGEIPGIIPRSIMTHRILHLSREDFQVREKKKKEDITSECSWLLFIDTSEQKELLNHEPGPILSRIRWLNNLF